MTHKPQTYSQTLFSLPGINVCASIDYILQLVLAGIEETEGTPATAVEYKLSVGSMHKQQEGLDNLLFFQCLKNHVLKLEFSGFEFSGEDETRADQTVIRCISPLLVLSGFLLLSILLHMLF